MRSHPTKLDSSGTSIKSQPERADMTAIRYRPQDSVAVVTGGAGAIGGAIAETLRSDGHQVVIVDRTGDVPTDLADASQVRHAAEVILRDHGHCDLLVHAAGAFDV
jgi:3-oxoacyl-[acyl-carrier protein] reductase